MKNKVRNPIFAFVLLILLLAAMGILLYYVSIISSIIKIELKNDMKLEGAVDTINKISEGINNNLQKERNKTLNNVKMTTAVLKQYVTEDGYEGPEIIDEGVVLRVKNNKIVYPDGFSAVFTGLEPKDLENQIHVAEMQKDDGSAPETYVLANGQITKDTWFTDYTEENEYFNYAEQMEKMNDLLHDTEKSYGGYIFMIDANDPEMNMLYWPDDFGSTPVKTISDIGISKDDIANQTHIIELNKKEYTVRYVNTSFSDIDVLVILMMDTKNDLYYSLVSVVLAVFIVLVIMSAVIFWLYLVQRYVQNHALTAEQEKAYHPHRVRKMTASVGVISLILFFIFAFSSQTIINLYNEATSSYKSLDVVMNHIVNSEKQDSRNRKNEEDWSVYYAEKIAALLGMDPDLRTHAFLEEVNNILGADYIMLFDENGDELVSSNSFVKFSLGTKEDDDTTDFRRLLKGVPSIVHEPTVEENSEQYVQMVGAAVPFDEENYGALILSINPKKTWQLSDKDELSDFIKMVTPEGNLCVIESAASGKIQYSSDPGLIGKTSAEVGLTVETEDSSMFDSFSVNGNHYYGTFVKNDNYHFFYLTETKFIQLNTVPFSLCSTLCFSIIFAVISVFMLIPYKADIYEKTVIVETETQSVMMGPEQEKTQLNENGKMVHLFFRLKDHLQNLTPEKQVISVLQFSLSTVFLIIMALYMFNSSSVISFILFGNWKRGINLMAFSGTVLLVLMFLVLVLFKNSMTSVMTNILDPKGLTIWKLSVNLIQYFMLILMLYFIFTYLGFNANVLLASFSAFSLAISLGAKDLVADILAGVFLVFEDNFHVNDIIEVDGYRGRVLEIGLRSTKLIGAGDNIKIIGNQSVKKIVNLSRLNSWYNMQLKVSADQPLDEIEEMLKQELPKIGASIPQVISGPFYNGVTAIDGNSNTLSLITECNEENFGRVQREVNRAIRLLFTEKGIALK